MTSMISGVAMSSMISASDGSSPIVSAEAWKRTVYKRPPRYFTVESLPPCKQGPANAYPMRICPTNADASSLASGSTAEDYLIHRRWSDCLWFQEEIEMTYARMAKEKRKALFGGKTVKSGSMYAQGPMSAASFDSLPSGPDPHSIPTNIHDILPRLNKKGVLFRISQSTIDQRAREFAALVAALMSDDVPLLIIELRATRPIRDFFGFWRRDHDAEIKAERAVRPRLRQSSSVSSGFSLSTVSLSNTEHPLLSPLPGNSTPETPSSPSPSFFGTSSSRVASLKSPTNFSRPLSAAAASVLFPPASAPASYNMSMSSQQCEGMVHLGPHAPPPSASQPSSLRESTNRYLGPSLVTRGDPSGSGSNPDHGTVGHSPLRLASLGSLPEDYELPCSHDFYSESDGDFEGLPPPVRRPRAGSAVQSNRQCQVIDDEWLAAASAPEMPSRHANRESWSSSTSAASAASSIQSSYLEHLPDVGFSHTPAAQSHRQTRASIGSVASFMTECSADAVIPRGYSVRDSFGINSSSGVRRSLSAGSKRSHPTVVEKSSSETEDSFYDSYFEYEPLTADTIRRHRPIAPLGHLASSAYGSSDHLSSFFSQRRLSTATTVSTAPSSVGTPSSPDVGDGMMAVKAAHEGTGVIVILKMPRSISLNDLRARLAEKFSGQENIPLDQQTFTMVHVPPSDPKPTTVNGRRRTSSFSSVGVFERERVDAVVCEGDWDRIVATHVRGKLALRVADSLL